MIIQLAPKTLEQIQEHLQHLDITDDYTDKDLGRLRDLLDRIDTLSKALFEIQVGLNAYFSEDGRVVTESDIPEIRLEAMRLLRERGLDIGYRNTLNVQFGHGMFFLILS